MAPHRQVLVTSQLPSSQHGRNTRSSWQLKIKLLRISIFRFSAPQNHFLMHFIFVFVLFHSFVSSSSVTEIRINLGVSQVVGGKLIFCTWIYIIWVQNSYIFVYWFDHFEDIEFLFCVYLNTFYALHPLVLFLDPRSPLLHIERFWLFPTNSLGRGRYFHEVYQEIREGGR